MSDTLAVGILAILLTAFVFIMAYIVGWGIELMLDRTWSVAEKIVVGVSTLMIAGLIGNSSVVEWRK